MGRRCIVNGCTSKNEENEFRQNYGKFGHAICPIHQKDNFKCGCSETTTLFSKYSFPKSPTRRGIWMEILDLPTNFQPKVNDAVCSKHFGSTESGFSSGRKKIPTISTGRSDAEVQDILSRHAKLAIEKHAVLGMMTTVAANESSNQHLADATTSAISSAEIAKSLQKRRNQEVDESVFENFGESLENIMARPDVQSKAHSGDVDVDILSQGMENVIVDAEPSGAEPLVDESPTLRLRKPRPSIRPKSIHDPRSTRTPSPQQRRPSSTIGISADETPPHGGKRPCDQRTPKFDGGECSKCPVYIAEISALKSENERLRRELVQLRATRYILETKRCDSCDEKDRKFFLLNNEVRRQANRISRMKKPEQRLVIRTRSEVEFSIDKMPPQRFLALFGIRKDAFKVLFDKLEPIARAATYWQGPAQTTTKKKPTPVEKKSRNQYKMEFLLFLMRLRLAPNMELLSFIFGWSIGMCSNVFNTWLDIFSRHFEWMISFPDSKTCRRLSPPHVAAAFPRLRCIIDCTEIFIQKPQAAEDQVVTYSRYKHHNTVKTIVAILPNGCIGFLSRSWGGRTSDNYVFYHSGLLDMLSSGDQVLADRGFLIGEELMRRGVEMNVPPGATGIAQFSIENVEKTKRIANIRIHVERTIGRMKTYKILNMIIPINMLPFVDKILKCVAILVNLQDELVR